MIIKQLRLHNIRSHEDSQIDFPEGIILLSGDIGSGKSSVLLAVEFALFGVKRGETTGNGLLRYGKREGSVILKIEVGKKEIYIKRVLKRMKYGVKQDSGYIIIDGVKTEGTAEELKAKVLEILGYPHDLLKKGKDLVYRFTVYTPQEQMKAILMESKDERLDTLRKVFGVDKYKRIKENSLKYITYLKGERKRLEGKVEGFSEKVKERERKNKEVNELKLKIKELEPEYENRNKYAQESKKRLQELEDKIDEFRSLENRLNVLDAQLNEKIDLRKNTKLDLEKLKEELKDLEKENLEKDSTDYGSIIKGKREELKQLEVDYNSVRRSLSECEIEINNCKEIIKKISNIDKCPTCEQDVVNEHKQVVFKRENDKIKSFSKNGTKLNSQLEDISGKIASTKKEIDYYLEIEKNQAITFEKIKALEDKNKTIEKYNEELERLKKQIGDLNSEKITLFDKLKGFKEVQKEYNHAKKEADDFDKLLRDKENELISLRTKVEEGEKIILLYDKEIQEKKNFKERIRKFSSLQNWMESDFLSLMSLMEKSVMAQLYKEFNELFIEWFRTLIEDETLNVRLDDQFTPLVEQNGYETDLYNLSGGEKTSIALAYRLSLNKVINDFITHIKTKDIIILDEPTDGFSQEQLDNVRDVIEQINVKQVIIVSHESKIESFVNTIIRVEKRDGVSNIC